MSHLRTAVPSRVRLARLAAIASLVGAACLASTSGASAQTAAPKAPVHHHYMRHRSAVVARETMENRITTLHAKLMITPDEETKWAAVAQVMRDNEAGMQRIVAERHSAAPHPVTAVEDLKTYEHFTQEHMNGLKNLISSFEILYAAMPAPQQATADQVFMRFGNRNRTLNG
jgi:leucyl aminopeptidase (aminopeptidase T)